MKAILIDDELHALQSLEYEIKQSCPFLQIVDKITDPRKAKQSIVKNQVDLVFIDIEMPWMSGFDVLNSMDELDFEIIFVTAYDQYAIKAFKFSAIDYLLKPVDSLELKAAVDKVRKKKNAFDAQHLQVLLQNLKAGDQNMERIVLPTAEGLEFIQVSEIIRCQSESNYTYVHLNGNRTLFLAKTLKEIETMLKDYGFIRIHNSHLIAEKYISKFIATDGGSILMSDGAEVPISRTKKAEFLGRYKN